ncbi:unnamed protein product (macronuclear) [Paramecium tetraurelia]|uniref:Uncharacterized protein n=1 Tax=Paramecium tetraurelia TaxID=5888 RepID=A0DLW1_PARTE|nr:uncharacterized protein GSPATT00039661001 [Paramecium tetraurelia]CAK84028.1 unnamed protein product [Paramecium tetraurelia]|eukprot:XP_001451425.1 hypothetical protein (macronuclear) [Paramecium tetraurelia strain d4-2]
MLQIKVSALPQNPHLINQIEQFLVDSNTLIRNGYYRKCITHLDGQYKKLLPIESPLLLRIKVLRRLCYCTLMYFKLKINKNEVNQGKNQFILWSRFQLYLRDFHDSISLLKIQFKKKFCTQELVSLMIKAILFRSQYYQKNQMVARGLLYLHHLSGTIIEQALIDKIRFFLCLQGQESVQIFIRKYNLITGNSYFQLQNYQTALKYYLKGLDLYQRNLIIVYKEITLTSLEEIKMTLNYYTKEIILSLFLIALVYEQMNDFLKYQETIKMMTWIDSNYQPENSIGKLYFQQYVDNTRYIEYALEKAEILKVLKQALPEEETSQVHGEEDQLNYYTNMLYEFSEFTKIKRQYYYYDKSQLPYTSEITESDTQLEKSRALKTNASVQMVYKLQPTENESTALCRSALLKTKNSDNGLSTRFQTESEGLSQTMIHVQKQKKYQKQVNKEDVTLQVFYGKAIEKSVKLQELESLAEQHNQDLVQQQADTYSFDKKLQQSKQQICKHFQHILEFKRIFGCIDLRKDPFEFETRESRKRQKKQQAKNINQLQSLLSIQIRIKTKTEQSQLLEQYNKQRQGNFSSAPNIFQQLYNKHRLNKDVRVEEKSAIVNKEICKEMSSHHKTQDEEQLIREININTKETIKKMMDEKESLISSKPFLARRSSQNNNIKNNFLSERLISKNDSLAHTTDQISNSKKLNSLKSLLEVPRNNPNQKRMTAILSSITPRPTSKMSSHTILPIC